jgi:hypothetical protein
MKGASFGIWIAILAMPLAAQTPSPAPEPDIVVQGKQEEAMRAFVGAMTDPDRSRQLTRWDDEICPEVVGIDPAQAALMEARIGEVAASLHLKAYTKGCMTSMLVIVDNDVARVVAALMKSSSITLRTDGRGRLNRFATSKRPVRWLSVTNPCGFEGCSLPNSRLSSTKRPAFQAMIIVIDGRQIGTFSLAELSDYVAFVALGNPSFGKNWPSTSILSMFDRPHTKDAQFALTGDDLAFLQGLYRSRTDDLGQGQRAAIVRRMTEKEDAPRP